MHPRSPVSIESSEEGLGPRAQSWEVKGRKKGSAGGFQRAGGKGLGGASGKGAHQPSHMLPGGMHMLL